MREKKNKAVCTPDLDLIGGNTALNFINTLRADAGKPLETLLSDEDVRAWMEKVELPRAVVRSPIPEGSLLESAKSLRAVALTVLGQSKAGKRINLTPLNQYLAQSRSHLTLRRSKDSQIINREYFADSAEQILAPLAEAIAALLAEADLSLVRRCEGSGCVLWFADRPGGRPRRFCTEETCGTRTRVAAHRARMRNALL